MDKGFQLQISWAVVADLGNFGQGQLTGQHNALGPQLIADLGGLVVCDARLGRDVALDLRGILFSQCQHAQVSDNKGIYACLGSILDILGQFGQFLVGGQSIQGQVDLFATGVGKDAALAQFAHRQVDRGCAHTKLRQGAVDGIRAVHDGVFQRFQAARRGQQFRLLQH